MEGKVLIVDDDRSIAQSLEMLFTRDGLEARCVFGAFEALEVLQVWLPDLIITDLKMPGMSGFELLDAVKRTHSSMPVIIISAYDDMQFTIEAIQRGAFDFIEKPIDVHKLRTLTESALEQQRLSSRADGMSETESDLGGSNAIVGSNASMREIFKRIGSVADSRVTVLIEGESGTGKELIARVLHDAGVTKSLPFVAINCAVLAEGLIESELFGHVKGAFTSAVREKKGKFELAGEGTIFLDEISEVSPAFQAKLLRIIQEREYQQVGGERTFKVRARVIAATNRDLAKLVREGKFREDLYYRLSVFHIDVPPLRERKDDIPKLVIHFLNKINAELKKNVCKIPYEVIEQLQTHPWPGNVRELENTLLQAVLRSKGDVLEMKAIEYVNDTIPDGEADEEARYQLSLAEIEKRHIRLVLDRTGWEKTRAAAVLGISKPTLNAKIRLYSLVPRVE